MGILCLLVQGKKDTHSRGPFTGPRQSLFDNRIYIGHPFYQKACLSCMAWSPVLMRNVTDSRYQGRLRQLLDYSEDVREKEMSLLTIGDVEPD